MSMSVNKVMLLGILGKDPDVKKTAQGQTVALLNVATSNAWTNKEGKRQESTEWHRVVVWGALAQKCGEYLSKGKKVHVEGRIQTRQWEDKQDQKRYTTEIIASQVLFLSDNTKPQTQNKNGNKYSNYKKVYEKPSEEELPF